METRTPSGFRDVLPLEAIEREELVEAMSRAISAWGYGPVETPVVELEETVTPGLLPAARDASFRLTDTDGRLLVLRPDMTMPIARLVASRLGSDAGPHRLRYVSEVFRRDAPLRGQSREFTQVGMELIGVSGPEGDAEVVSVLVEALRAVGLQRFTVAIGTVGVLSELISGAGMPHSWCEEVMAAAHGRNLVALDALAGQPGVPAEIASALSAVTRIRGGKEAIALCRQVLPDDSCRALDVLEESWGLLETMGVDDQVLLDFGVMRSFGYYTGMVLEIYAPGIGLPLGGGGRYDSLLGQYGRSAPAAGFAISLDRVHLAVAEENGSEPRTVADTVVCGDPVRAFAAAREMRAAGRIVELAVGRDCTKVAAEATAKGMDVYECRRDGEVVKLSATGSEAGEAR